MEKATAREFLFWYIKHHKMDVYDFVLHAWMHKHNVIPEIDKLNLHVRFILDNEHFPSYVVDYCKIVIGHEGIGSPMYKLMPDTGGRN